jgi:hypothetical protein
LRVDSSRILAVSTWAPLAAGVHTEEFNSNLYRSDSHPRRPSISFVSSNTISESWPHGIALSVVLIGLTIQYLSFLCRLERWFWFRSILLLGRWNLKWKNVQITSPFIRKIMSS